MVKHQNDDENAWMEQSAWDNLPKSEVFWKRGNGNTSGDDSPDNLWRAVGLALTSYEDLEEELAELFRFFIESNSKAALRAYGVSSGRQNLLTEASKEFFNRRNGYISDIDEFNSILKHYSCAASFRNEIAHGIVRNFRLNDSDTAGKWFLVAPSYNSRKTRSSTEYTRSTYKLAEISSTYRYNAENVENRAVKCRALQKSTHFFSIKLAQVYEHDILTGFKKFPQLFDRTDKRRVEDDKAVSNTLSKARS